MPAQPSSIPAAIQGQKYILLTTFRKNGVGVPTPIWFGEENGKLYLMTIGTSGKIKRIKNNPQVKVAACTMRGRVTGPEFSATARIMAQSEGAAARKTINRKYWLAKISTWFSRADAFLELSITQ